MFLNEISLPSAKRIAHLYMEYNTHSGFSESQNHGAQSSSFHTDKDVFCGEEIFRFLQVTFGSYLFYLSKIQSVKFSSSYTFLLIPLFLLKKGGYHDKLVEDFFVYV